MRPLGFVRAAWMLLVLWGAACGPPPSAPAAAPEPRPALSLTGRRILLLPVQSVSGLPSAVAAEVDAELAFALAERDTGVVWVTPAELRRVLRRSPGVAPDPGRLPDDPLVHQRERRAVEPLAGILRRYAAVTDARWVVLPRSMRAEPGVGSAATLRLNAVVIDARTGDVLAEGAGEAVGNPADPALLPSVAADLARRIVAPPEH